MGRVSHVIYELSSADPPKKERKKRSELCELHVGFSYCRENRSHVPSSKTFERIVRPAAVWCTIPTRRMEILRFDHRIKPIISLLRKKGSTLLLLLLLLLVVHVSGSQSRVGQNASLSSMKLEHTCRMCSAVCLLSSSCESKSEFLEHKWLRNTRTTCEFF